MSKRSLEESRSQAPEGDNGLLPIQDLLSPGDEQDSATQAGANKKARNFIATVVCIPFPDLICNSPSNWKRLARLAA